MKEKINTILSLLNNITNDGKITEENVKELQKFLPNEDGTYNINREIADRLYELLNMAKNGQVIDDSFYSLFKDAICAYLLKDHSSTGILDDKEVDWLVGHIENNLEIDDTIFELIQELKAKSFNNFPKKLDSAIILRRLRVILDLLSNSETDNGCKEKVEDYISALNKYLEKRKKFSVNEDCIIILFSIKKKIVLNKRLGFNIEENLDNPKTVEYKFAKLFYDIVSSFVLYDENSPYDIDDDEAKLLMKSIYKNDSADILDKVLLDQLKSRSMDFPELLAKAQFEIKTSDVRALIVNVLAKDKVEAKDKEEAINQLDAYLFDSFGCIDEQKLKAGLLFKLKNLTKPDITDDEENDIVSEIRKKFVEKVTEYITGANSQSPNEIDEKEEKWLIEELSVSEDRYYLCDEELLKQLKEKSVNYPKSLELLLSNKIMKRKLLEFRDEDWKWEQFDGDDLNEIKSALYDDYNEIKTDKKGAAEFIFKIKDIIYKKTNDSKEKKGRHKKSKDERKHLEKFEELFIDVVSSYLLEDEKSLGRVDKAEEEWLLAKMQSNGELDSYDEHLLDKLEKRSINPPSVLHRTEKPKRVIGTVLYGYRKISYVAVISSLIASLLLFVIGASHVVNTIPFQENVMVVDQSRYKSIISEAGISGNDVRFKKVRLYVGGNSYKFKNVRLVVKPYNEGDMSGGIMMGVHNTKQIIKKKPDKYHPREGFVKADKVYLSGISNGSGISGHKSNIEISVDSLYLAKRDRLSMHSSSEKNTAFVEIIEAVDAFLVALVVFILGIGIYELFIRKLEKPYKIRENRPSWMRMSSIDDLKSSLVKVLIIAMIVGFYKRSLLPDFKKEDLLFLAIGIVLIAIAFCVTEISAHYHNKSKEGNSKQIQSETNKEKK